MEYKTREEVATDTDASSQRVYNSWGLIVFLICIALISSSYAAYLTYILFGETPEPVGESQSVQGVTDPTEWKWIDEGAIISVEYPADWSLQWGDSFYNFQQAPGLEAHVWSIRLIDNGRVAKKVTIDKMGIHFPDRRVESEEEIFINGMSATKVVVVSDSYPYLREVAILIDGSVVDRPETFVIISNHGNNFPFFERFYKSFTLKVPQTWEVARSQADENLAKTEPQLKPKTASAIGTLDVVYLGDNTYQLSGELTPPSPCTGNELIQFNLMYGNGSNESYSVADCQPHRFSETTTISKAVVSQFPELILRQVNSGTNVWTNYLQVRYKIDTSGATPVIQRL